jgi:hypothetical protein
VDHLWRQALHSWKRRRTGDERGFFISGKRRYFFDVLCLAETREEESADLTKPAPWAIKLSDEKVRG